MFGVLLAYLKRRDVGGTYPESHVVWQTRTFWIWLALWLAGRFTVILVVGWLLLGLDYVWLIYRIIKGWMLLPDARPIEQPESRLCRPFTNARHAPAARHLHVLDRRHPGPPA